MCNSKLKSNFWLRQYSKLIINFNARDFNLLCMKKNSVIMNCQTEIDTGIGSGEINVTAMDFSTTQ